MNTAIASSLFPLFSKFCVFHFLLRTYTIDSFIEIDNRGVKKQVCHFMIRRELFTHRFNLVVITECIIPIHLFSQEESFLLVLLSLNRIISVIFISQRCKKKY